MWRCLNCDEEIDDNFDVCWNCETVKNENSPQVVTTPQSETVSDAHPQQSRQRPTMSRMESALSSRYKDAYLASKVAVGIGSIIKIVGIIIGVLILIATFAVVSSTLGVSKGEDNSAAFLAALMIGAINAFTVGFLFYVVGILVSAQGQILKASLVSAVNGSPFLSNERKAKMMSLPEA